jgi:hypothetical protein
MIDIGPGTPTVSDLPKNYWAVVSAPASCSGSSSKGPETCWVSSVPSGKSCNARLTQRLPHMSMLVFWVATPCGLVGGYQRFGGTYCLYLQGWWRLETVCSSKTLVSAHKSTRRNNVVDKARRVWRRTKWRRLCDGHEGKQVTWQRMKKKYGRRLLRLGHWLWESYGRKRKPKVLRASGMSKNGELVL